MSYQIPIWWWSLEPLGIEFADLWESKGQPTLRREVARDFFLSSYFPANWPAPMVCAEAMATDPEAFAAMVRMAGRFWAKRNAKAHYRARVALILYFIKPPAGPIVRMEDGVMKVKSTRCSFDGAKIEALDFLVLYETAERHGIEGFSQEVARKVIADFRDGKGALSLEYGADA